MTAARETHEILEFHGFPLFMFRLHQAQGEKKVGQKRDKIATKVGQNRDELYRFLCYTGFTTPGSPFFLIRLALRLSSSVLSPSSAFTFPHPSCPAGNPPSPKGKVMGRTNSKQPHPRPSPWGEGAAKGGGRGRIPFATKRGPRRSPTKWVRWGEEEQGSGARATRGSPSRSGLCNKNGAPGEAQRSGFAGERRSKGAEGVMWYKKS